jgi:N-acetylmuramoyl-L-alanine amidase
MQGIKFLFLLLAGLAILACSSFNWPSRPLESPVQMVVLDPGHGGKDPGAVGTMSKEKNIALSISQKTRDLIKYKKDGMRVKMTRDDDTFIGLYDRARFANQNGADLFLSIHVNASTSPEPHGTETFAMGVHKNKANLKVMKRENSAILMEENHEEKYNGFNPKSEEATIMFKLRQHAYLKQSLTLAREIENAFQRRTKRASRGVKQAGFLVLWKTTMPSVLVETGFISNPNDQKFLNTEVGQKHMANAIYQAILDYRQQQTS